MGLGLVAAIVSLFVNIKGMPISPFALGGAFVYLIGGVLAVGAFDYVKGSKVFLAIRIMRVVFAVIVMVSVFRGMQA